MTSTTPTMAARNQRSIYRASKESMGIQWEGKRGKDGGGRLAVGYLERDWTTVWYEPITDSEDPDGGAEMALFRADNPTGEADYREPMEGETRWDAYFDPANMESKSKKERLVLQKRFLYDAWKYCNENDPEKLAELEGRFERDKSRKWQSWFEKAKEWKKGKMKRRQTKRREWEQTVQRAGIDLREVEVNSDSSDDSGYDDDGDQVPWAATGDMPPPRRPTGGNIKRKANGCRANGGGSAAKRARPNSDAGSASGLFMSGGLGSRSTVSRSVSRPRAAASGSVNGDVGGDDDDDDYTADWDSRHPSLDPDPGPSLQGPYSPGGAGGAAVLDPRDLNAWPTPISTQLHRAASRTPNRTLNGAPNGTPNAPPRRRNPSRTPNGSLRQLSTHELPPFDQWANPSNSAQPHYGRHGSARSGVQADNDEVENGLFVNDNTQRAAQSVNEPEDDGDNIVVSRSTRNSLRPENGLDIDDGEGLRRAAEINGVGLDDDEALQQALRQSMPPEDRGAQEANGGREMPDGYIHPSVEDGEQD